MSHVRDVYFLMITLALGMVLWGVSYRWIPVTGGDNGISGIPRLEAHAGLPVSGAIPFYYVALLVFAASAGLMALVVRSPFGFTLRGIRENESRMKSLGFNTWLHCYLSYVIVRRVRQRGGRGVGVLQRLRQPDVPGSHRVVGTVPDGHARRPRHAHRSGAGRRARSCCSKNVISAYTQRWLLILGTVYIVTILAAPQGLWNFGLARKQQIVGLSRSHEGTKTHEGRSTVGCSTMRARCGRRSATRAIELSGCFVRFVTFVPS